MGIDRTHWPPKFSKPVEQMEQVEALLNSPYGHAIFTPQKRQELQTQLQSMRKVADDIFSIIKRFDDVFQPMGWIMSESTDIETVRRALELADNQKMEEAEQVLCDDFEGRNLDIVVMRLKGSQFFLKRLEILNEAIALTHERRFLAAVPLILLIADGAGHDIFRLSIFREDLNLTEINAIAGHSEGLQSLTAMFAKTRRAFNDDEITVPYRNGIMHGRDNRYGNRLVTSKAWSYLSCLRDIVRARAEREAVKPEPELSLGQIVEMHQDTRLQQEMFESWAPRKKDTVPGWKLSTGDLEEISSLLPEPTLKMFLSAWHSRNFGKMGSLTVDYILDRSASRRAGEIREMLSDIILMDADLVESDDSRANETNITCNLKLKVLGQKMNEQCVFWMQYVDHENMPVVRDHKSGTWKVVPRYYGYSSDLKNKVGSKEAE
jgi:hypothetical protein